MFAYSTSIKFRRSINKKNTLNAENMLNSKKVKNYLTKNELSQLRAELSHALFIFEKELILIKACEFVISPM